MRLYGNREFLVRIHLKLSNDVKNADELSEKPKSATGRLFAGGQGWFLVTAFFSSISKTLEAWIEGPPL